MAKREGLVFVDADACKGCRLCVVACPTESLRIGTDLNRLGYYAVEFLPETGCTACGVCFYACPEPGAITVTEKQDRAA